MIIDTSALVSVVLSEPGSDRLLLAIARAAVRTVPAPALVEATAVILARKGAQVERGLDAVLARLDISVAPLSAAGAAFARRGYAMFGKAAGSPAVLNFGDCLTYGVVMDLGDELLFTGTDFSQTDVAVAAY